MQNDLKSQINNSVWALVIHLMFNLETFFIFVMNVTLSATEFPAWGTAVPKNQRQDLEEVLQSHVAGLLPIFHLPS